MKNITQKLLELIVPVELLEEFKLQDIIVEKHFVELVLVEQNLLPRKTSGVQVELMRYEKTQILTFPLKGKQCRLTLNRKRWKLKKTNKTIMNEVEFKWPEIKATNEFGKYLVKTIEQQVTDIPRIARIMKIPDTTLRTWYQKHLTDMEQVADENVVVEENMGTKLKIDEVCLHRGDFWTILSDSNSKKACAIMKGTKVDELRRHIEKFSLQQRFAVEEVTLDMSQSFDWLIREYFPNAMMVVDRFHVQMAVAKAVQELRIRERRKLKDDKDKTVFLNGDTRKQLLARSRGLLFKSRKSWTESQKERAEILFREYPEIKMGYELSQDLKTWYDKKYGRTIAKRRLEGWYETVRRANLKPMIEAMETIKRHEGRILNYFYERSTNAFAESLNSKIKLFKMLVRGVNVPKYFIYRLSRYIC